MIWGDGVRSKGFFWVIRWKRLWSVTFKRWATPQGTSATTHTHNETHTQTTVSSYLLMNGQADRRREEVNESLGREWNKYLPLRRQPLYSLKKVVYTSDCENTSIVLNDTHKHTDINYPSVLLFCFIPHTPPLSTVPFPEHFTSPH